ncbi:hypothetical protein QF050_003082 [Arthrobacter sp. SLBN-112]|nr:hypothetical protein [Arthrobacter sp. SLBN-112]
MRSVHLPATETPLLEPPQPVQQEHDVQGCPGFGIVEIRRQQLLQFNQLRVQGRAAQLATAGYRRRVVPGFEILPEQSQPVVLASSFRRQDGRQLRFNELLHTRVVAKQAHESPELNIRGAVERPAAVAQSRRRLGNLGRFVDARGSLEEGIREPTDADGPARRSPGPRAPERSACSASARARYWSTASWSWRAGRPKMMPTEPDRTLAVKAVLEPAKRSASSAYGTHRLHSRQSHDRLRPHRDMNCRRALRRRPGPADPRAPGPLWRFKPGNEPAGGGLQVPQAARYLSRTSTASTSFRRATRAWKSPKMAWTF